ncbi:hypothetical protein [Streptomyces sp. ME19-01-6]|uniref:hypothetical protein n=1 Tax=Streptomyces sp. ME19-01-6 TaxID=3028686 RepID=UPI0029BB403D|nr:hypothetical protein [Streptomyces sp. ME19-01-6]MDX3230556.1 hypothetical protein [Streptomyces sp. ME19-01-6]
MTTRTKPLPPHGSYARANGSPGYRPPCKCEPCVLTRRAKKKREHVNRQLGRPNRVDAAEARTRLLQLNETMGWNDIGTAAGCSPRHLHQIALGRVTRINRGTHDKIMAAKQGTTGGVYIDATGSIRRVRALLAIGHSIETIATTAGGVFSRIQPIAAGQPRMRRMLADKIAHAYNVLADQPGTSSRSRNRAASEGWAPPAAWDDDTIDNPQAHPDWTGHCGTDHGWWLHRLNNIPTCQRCETAHQQWLADLGPATSSERFTALRKARAAASSRGADLADDARELITLGYGHDAIAERLQVTKEHLYQTLKRHPQSYEEAA